MSDRLIEECSKIRREKCGQLLPVLDSESNCSYVNASIHGLFACEVFRTRVIRQGIKNKHLYYYYSLADLFIKMTIGIKKMYSTDELRKMVSVYNHSFDSSREHDPLDFIRGLLDLLHQSSDVVSDTTTLVTDAFRGIFNITMTCSNNHRWTSPQHFNVASLFVPYSPQPTKLQKQIRFIGNFPIDVNIKCINCDSIHVTARKTFNYTADHLILHLQRENEEEGDKKSKICLEDVITVLKEQYNLVAIICFHKERGVVQAYSCYAKLYQKWYQFRRNYVIEEQTGILDNQNAMENAHILFYRKSSIAGNYDDIDSKLRAMRVSNKPNPRNVRPKPISDQLICDYKLSERRGVGIVNLRNTCYMNAIIQSLFHCNEFRVHIMSGQHNGMFYSLLKNLFEQLFNTYEPYISAEHFRREFVMVFPHFVAGQPHDSRQFLTSLINKLFAEGKGVRVVAQNNIDFETSEEAWHKFLGEAKNPSLADILWFQNECRNVCQLCNYAWNNYDHQWIFEIFPENMGQNVIDVQSCLNIAMMSRMVYVHCQRCTRNTEVKRIKSISRAPRILIIVILIDLNDPRACAPIKMNVKLKVNELVLINNENYSCFASVMHIGRNANFGHCTAFCKRGNNWFLFDDTAVSLSSTKQMPNQHRLECSYILFYENCIENVVGECDAQR